jgi:hypothetical protein
MTTAEAIQFAAALPAQDRFHTTPELIALRCLRLTASNTAKQRVLASLLGSAEAYRNTDTLGHSTWYDYYLRAAAWAAKNLQEEKVTA